METINHSNIVILAYNEFSCGKFISNVLSYNKNFIPQFPLDGNRAAWYSKEHYDVLTIDEIHSIKHQTIMLTIPPIDLTTEWREYEIGCFGFWGTGGPFYNTSTVSQKALWLLDQGVNCFIVAHNLKELKEKRNSFPNASVVRIVNDHRINRLSRQLKMKNPTPFVDKFNDFPHNDCIEFDIDCIFDKTLFFNNIQNLLTDLRVSDTSLDLNVYEYYQSYCNLYKNLLQ